jgi:ABC-2 type transport system ATP-binding protein
MMRALEAAGISKSYGDRAALSGVNLVADRGQLHGLLGSNGAGKTTLLRILLGLARRSTGSVRLLGRPFNPPSEPVPDRVAGVVETPAFYPYLSGRKNLALVARLDNVDDCGAASIEAALAQTGLAAAADAAVAGYSAGMRQRLALAAALLRSPQLLFLDEPTSALDPRGARDVRALARYLAENGAAVVFSSHDMTEVEELCTTVTILDRGRVVFSGTVDELRSRAPAAAHALHTNDDTAARALAARRPGIRIGRPIEVGFEVLADLHALDEYILALGRAGIAVRSLERRVRSLESVFLDLTGDEAEPGRASDGSEDLDWGAA